MGNDGNTVLSTTFVSNTQLTAIIPAALLSKPATAKVFVQRGDPEDDIPTTRTNELGFSIQAPPQSLTLISTISPINAPEDSPDLTLTLTGANFGGGHNHSQVIWAANDRATTLATTFVGTTELTAVIPAALLTAAGAAQVFVETSDLMGEVAPHVSNKLTFTVIHQGGTGAILVYGQTSTLPFRGKGSRDVALDGSGWITPREGDSVSYRQVAGGVHQLLLSKPRTGNHQPSVEMVTAVADSTVTVPVSIPAECE